MNKVYVVTEFGGEYEDSWERIIGVCKSIEKAESLKAEIEKEHNKEIAISEEEWNEMWNKVNDYEDEYDVFFDSTEEGMKTLFPKISEKDIEDAIAKYDSYDDWSGVQIKEVNYYAD